MNSSEDFLLSCRNYNDYLDSFSLPMDMGYFRNHNHTRMLVKLGYRSNNPVFTAEQFEEHKAAAIESLYPTKISMVLFSHGLTTKDSVLVQLAMREQPNVQKTISTIIFLKVRRKSGFKISGYIDYEQSLRQANRKEANCVDWAGVFQEKVMLRPTTKDMSFYDWKTGTAEYNDTDNFLVHHDVDYGLIFVHRGDHKNICVDMTKKIFLKDFSCGIWFSEVYGYVIFYDHVIRKKI